MKLPTSILHLVLICMLGVLSSCDNNRYESQLMRPDGVLSVRVLSYTQGGIHTTAGAKPQVVASLDDGTKIVVEQAEHRTTLSVDGVLYALVPSTAKNLEIDLKKTGLTVEVDGVSLPKDQGIILNAEQGSGPDSIHAVESSSVGR